MVAEAKQSATVSRRLKLQTIGQRIADFFGWNASI
jgi:hypothetical protein